MPVTGLMASWTARLPEATIFVKVWIELPVISTARTVVYCIQYCPSTILWQQKSEIPPECDYTAKDSLLLVDLVSHSTCAPAHLKKRDL